MSADQVPPFSLDKPRYDTSTYVGRWRKFSELVSPKWLFLSSEDIQHATQTLEGFRHGTLTPGQYKDAELWDLRQAYEAAVHPQTGETVPAAFRLSAFMPVNIPICVGMLLAAPTLGNTIFWQWVNQSYNAGFNYANRNASSEQDNSTILKSYATATFVSCSMAVGLGKMVEKAKGISPGTRSFLGKMVPFVAVAGAGAFNAVSMRFNEFQEGIDIMDEHGDVHGRSVAAGRQSLGQVALTRVALPMPTLLLPPYLYEIMKKTNIMPKAKYPKLAAELVVLTLCLWGAMPSAVALFPQMGTISADSVEEEFRSRVDRNGQPIRHFIYNKGI
ncbi:Mitochondrial Tricarboxylate Carrier (MTC) Family [Phytophthora cinnamomi]|uniref:Mitochondrial Tricarboxylate Carrier (MTC) Family n=3 Tax=Phytophthora cinnamomi TaxID=4785 RepID=UPI00355A9ABC|nr:Mitochondrial Tricarboxylate Carrier (MTC) Family [Phytophthora cinnamomi]